MSELERTDLEEEVDELYEFYDQLAHDAMHKIIKKMNGEEIWQAPESVV